jgi:argininosuccinate lyase
VRTRPSKDRLSRRKARIAGAATPLPGRVTTPSGREPLVDSGLVSLFAKDPDPAFHALNASIGFDFRLAPYDLEQSAAHARMLARCGIIGADDLSELERGLAQVREEIEHDRFEVKPGDEDVHLAIERRLIEIAGPVGGKLHTARSRNDQVATDVAMFVRAHSLSERQALLELMGVVVELAERHLDWPLPGYTHLQRAQPVYLSHHLLAHFWRFRRDLQRFNFCLNATTDLPLGAGALAGVNFDTSRMSVARDLGFAGIAENSMDAVSNRDFVLDYLSAAATCATHLSQLGAELVLWSSVEFGFCRLDDSYSSGSSIMPQKKNPDAAELLRAKAPRIAGHLVALHGVLHGLPLTYNKDLQEDKEHLFDSVDTLELCIAAATGMLRGASFDRQRMTDASADEFLAATDVADALVRRGVPFREAHGVVAGLVRRAVEQGTTLSGVERSEVEKAAPGLSEELGRLLDRGEWLESKVSEGGTSLARVRDQLAQAHHVLEEAGE